MSIQTQKISLNSEISPLSFFILVVLTFFGFQSLAQSSGLDAKVKYGKLKNGFTYYIRANKEPQQRAQLYLVNKVGSILETETQRGLAHFLEHMAFNGTTHFPKQQLIDYLQKAGVSFGSDLNAYTAFDETVYQLPIPTDDEALFGNALQIMRDWAQGLLLHQADIDKERGVILEEKRLGQGISQRIADKTLPVLFNGSLYAQRLPIGTERVIKNFKREEIVSFYEDWYRPDLQALIIVGDIDATKVEQQVNALFADLRMPKNAKPRPEVRVDLDGRNQFLTITDPEISHISLELQIKHEDILAKDEASYKATVVRTIATQLFAGRIAEYAEDPTIPMLAVQAGYGEMVSNVVALSLAVVPDVGQFQEAVEAAWAEVVRVKQFGFTQAELDRLRIDYLSSIDMAIKELDKRRSDTYVSEYQKHFTSGVISPGVEVECRWTKEVLDKIDLAELHLEIQKLLKDSDRDIVISANTQDKASLPTESVVLAWLDQVEKSALIAHVDKAPESELLSFKPEGGQVVNVNKIEALGITELTLSNGVKIVLKPTDFQNDAIQFRSFSPGGTSLYSDVDFESAQNAVSILTSSGVGSHDPIALPKLLTGKQVGVKPYISECFEGINGNSNQKDLETALQLTYLYLTEPRADTAIFKRIITNAEVSIKTRYDKPENVFSDTVSAVMNSYHFRRLPTTVERLRSIDLNRVLSIYKDRFEDMGDFTFVFTGSFNIDSITPLLARYLGGLPSKGRSEVYKNLDIHPIVGSVSKTVYKGKEDKASVILTFDGKYTSSPFEDLKMKALGQILEYRLMERLRERESGVYTPGVDASWITIPTGQYTIAMSFGCSTGNVKQLINATIDEVKKIQVNGVSEVDLHKFKSEELRQKELSLRDNSFWLAYLTDAYREGRDPKEVLEAKQLVQQLTAADIQKAAVIYLREDSLKKFVHMPENK